jgi:hypothetical protein
MASDDTFDDTSIVSDALNTLALRRIQKIWKDAYICEEEWLHGDIILYFKVWEEDADTADPFVCIKCCENAVDEGMNMFTINDEHTDPDMTASNVDELLDKMYTIEDRQHAIGIQILKFLQGVLSNRKVHLEVEDDVFVLSRQGHSTTYEIQYVDKLFVESNIKIVDRKSKDDVTVVPSWQRAASFLAILWY